jgi:hypothetical protein
MAHLSGWYSEAKIMEKIISKLLPGDKADGYIKDVLTIGGATSFPVGSEPVFAIAPERTDTAQLLNFSQGGILTATQRISDGRTSVQLVATTVPTAASIVHQEMLHFKQPALWIHEPLLTDEEISLKKLPHLIIEGKIYFVFEGNLEEVRIAELIRYSLLSWHFLAFVTDGRGQVRCVDDLVISAKLILVGAYDGESFLYKRGRA